VHNSLRNGRWALALAQESKNDWVQVSSSFFLAYGLLEVGAYEEALVLMQDAVALARTLPQGVILQSFLTALGSVYHAVQLWEEARSTLQEAVAEAERVDFGTFGIPALSQLCKHYAEAGEWEAAYRYAVKAIALRKRSDTILFPGDFSRQYETEALLRRGDERLAREEVHRLGEGLGVNRRFRLPYLRSRALLARWEGQSEQAIGHLREAAGLAADLGLPGEQWRIQAALGRVYEARGQHMRARTAFGKAATILQRLAQGIRNEARRSHFLAAPQIQRVLRQAQSQTSLVPKSHAGSDIVKAFGAAG
jgi:tetratricopeptide (TPR) repeat protein